MVRFVIATFSLLAVALVALIGVRTIQEANADCLPCNQDWEASCENDGGPETFCDDFITDDAESGTLAFYAETSFRYCEQEIPELGWFEAVAESAENIVDNEEGVLYYPDVFFPETVGTHCAIINVAISGNLQSAILNGSVNSRGAVWTPYNTDEQMFYINKP